MAPVLVGPGRGRGPAAALRPGPVEETLVNIAEPAPGDLELDVIYSRVHVKVRAGGSPQPFSLSMVPPPLGGHPQLFCHESNWQFKALCNFFNSVPTTAFVAKFNWFASWPPHTIPRFTAWVKRNPAPRTWNAFVVGHAVTPNSVLLRLIVMLPPFKTLVTWSAVRVTNSAKSSPLTSWVLSHRVSRFVFVGL